MFSCIFLKMLNNVISHFGVHNSLYWFYFCKTAFWGVSENAGKTGGGLNLMRGIPKRGGMVS